MTGGPCPKLPLVLALLLTVAAGCASRPSAEASAVQPSETVLLIPDGSKYWSLRNLFAPLTSLFLGPGYWYGERTVTVQSTPPGAVLDLFYLRRGFQKRYEQALAPVRIRLPKRVDANPKDLLKVRAFLEGYRYTETTVPVKSRQDYLEIELGLLPNTLEAVAHTYFAGRESLTLLTKEVLSVRIQERDDGFNVAMTETGRGAHLSDVLESVSSPIVRKLEAVQLGEDLLVQVRYTPAAQRSKLDLRSRVGRDPIRDLHLYSLDLVEPDGGARAVERMRTALAGIRTADVTGCALRFDTALRDGLDRAALARALSPRGSWLDPYLRAAMKRLGEVSPGHAVEMADGSRLRTNVPFELAAASNQAAEAKGFLALLERLVQRLESPEFRATALRSLVAPELSPSAFTPVLDRASAAERRCRG